MLIEIPDAYALAVGKFVTLWAYEEWLLKDIVGTLLNLSQKQERLVVKDFRADEYPELICTLAELAGLKAKLPERDVKMLSQLLAKCETMRNQFAHSIWMKDGDDILLRNTRGNWPKQPFKGKVSKRIAPEGMLITEETLKAVLGVMQGTIKLTLSLWSDVQERMQTHNAKRFRPPQ